jgi:5'-nucleotidase
MHILVTNDDGITAPGLLALTNAVKKFGKVTVLAPDHNWSASGHVKTLSRPLRVRETKLANGTPALTSDGAPSDCVALAVLGLLRKKVDLVVSGINSNSNLGFDLTYSGTVTAAMEAAISGIPSAAFSLAEPKDNPGTRDYSLSHTVIQEVVTRILAHGLPEGVLLNVNIPYIPEDKFKGYQITRQGLRLYHDNLLRRKDPEGRPYYWIGGDPPSGVAEEGTDIGALADNYVSITPIHLDLTAHAQIEKIGKWDWANYQ